MTIRRILLAAFLLVSLLPAAVLTLLAFDRTRAAMLGEIEQGVSRSAAALSSEIDRALAERLLNATTWNHLEVMQDLRIGDIDKRLSGFLSEMKRRYGGAYLDLLAVDQQGRVVAASSPARIGQALTPGGTWFAATLAGGAVRLERVRDGRLTIRSDIDSEFTSGRLGELVLELDWSQIQGLLDAAADTTRQALLLDRDGQLVAASAVLRSRGATAGSAVPPALQQGEASAWMPGRLLVGRATSGGAPGFAGFGWTTLLLQDRASALAPVQRMAWTFAGLLAATALVVGLASLWVAGLIARPVSALTDFTRRYTEPGPPPPVPPQGPGEIGELNRSFMHMVEELQRSQSTLAQASRLAALGEVTALMAHEVRTPLGILRSSAQMLRLEPALSGEGQELVRIVESETERLNRLVSSLLDSTRTRPPERRCENLHEIARHSFGLLAAQARDRGIELRLEFHAARAWVDCDAEQITQVLLNLVMNALQILKAGGHVQLSTRDDGERLVLEVADDGPGIAAEDRARIFEPFVFKREGGIGLGLAVVRQILRAHGGDISADASVSGGALFRLRLPLSQDVQP